MISSTAPCPRPTGIDYTQQPPWRPQTLNLGRRPFISEDAPFFESSSYTSCKANTPFVLKRFDDLLQLVDTTFNIEAALAKPRPLSLSVRSQKNPKNKFYFCIAYGHFSRLFLNGHSSVEIYFTGREKSICIYINLEKKKFEEEAKT